MADQGSDAGHRLPRPALSRLVSCCPTEATYSFTLFIVTTNEPRRNEPRVFDETVSWSEQRTAPPWPRGPIEASVVHRSCGLHAARQTQPEPRAVRVT